MGGFHIQSGIIPLLRSDTFCTCGTSFLVQAQPLGKGVLLNAWTGSFHCLSRQKLNTDNVCSHCTTKITSVCPCVCSTGKLCACLCVCVCARARARTHRIHHGNVGHRGLTEAFDQVTFTDPSNVRHQPRSNTPDELVH